MSHGTRRQARDRIGWHPRRSFPTLLFLVLGVAALAEMAGAKAGEEIRLMEPVPDSARPLEQPGEQRVASARLLLRTARIPGAEVLVLPFFEDRSFTARRLRLDLRGPGDFSWFGRLEEPEEGFAIVTVQGDHTIVRVRIGERVWLGRTDPAGGLRVEELLPVPGSDCGLHAEDFLPGALHVEALADVPDRPRRDEPETARQDTGEIIDLMVVFTAQARQVGGGGLANEIQSWIDEINMVYEASGILPRINLVHVEEVEYTESGRGGTDLDRLVSPTDGFLDPVHPLRDEHCADIVSLIVSDAGGGLCGIARFMFNVSTTFAPLAFNVTQLNCARTNLTLPHEMGHNMGCAHDREATSASSRPYGFGFVDANGRDWRTVMAVFRSDIPRVGHFSNPDVEYFGEPTGIPQGNPDSADNAQTIDVNAFSVANFRDSEVCLSNTCSEDPFEPDNLCFSAPFFSGEMFRNYAHCTDASDWVRFGGRAGETYTITTSALGSAADTRIQLLREDCFSLVAEDDSGGVGVSDRVEFTPGTDGCFALRISQADDGFGLDRQYTLTVDGDHEPSLCCPELESPGTLTVEPDGTLRWTGPATATYNVYRGSQVGLFEGYNHACLESDLAGTTAQDGTRPGGNGRWFYYLVSGTADCGETGVGRASTGTARPLPAPCP